MYKNNLLDLIIDSKKYNVVNLDNLSLVTYKQTKKQTKNEINTNQNIFIIVLKGKKIIYSEGKKFIIKENESVFISKGTYLMSEVLANESKSFESLVFFFDDTLLKEFFTLHQKNFSQDNHLLKIYEKTFRILVSPFLKSTIDSILTFFSYENTGRETFLKYKFFEILLEIIKEDKSHNFLSFLYKIQNVEISKLQEFMEKNFTRSLTIEEFSKETNRSLSKFKKDFSIFSDLPPKEWINNKRLELAKTLLKTSGHNITEIAMELGFDSVSYFSKVFSNKFNESPKKFQKKLKQKN